MTARPAVTPPQVRPTTAARKAAAALVDRCLAQGVAVRVVINPAGEVVIEPLTQDRDGLDGVVW